MNLEAVSFLFVSHDKQYRIKGKSLSKLESKLSVIQTSGIVYLCPKMEVYASWGYLDTGYQMIRNFSFQELPVIRNFDQKKLGIFDLIAEDRILEAQLRLKQWSKNCRAWMALHPYYRTLISLFKSGDMDMLEEEFWSDFCEALEIFEEMIQNTGKKRNNNGTS